MAMEKRSAQTGRKAWADVCRCVAMLGVIVIHAGAPAFYQFGKLAPLDWWAVNFLDAFSRPAVPLFVMLSGALLLWRDGAPVTLAEVFRRVLKIGVPLLAWSVLYVLWTAGFTVDAAALRAIVRGPVMYHLWFCYMILGLYLLLPLLQALFQAIVDRKDLCLYFLLLWFIVHCVTVYRPLAVLQPLGLAGVLGYGGYFVMGGVLTAHLRAGARLPWLGLYVAASLLTCFLAGYFSARAGQSVETSYVYTSPNVLLASVGAFIALARTQPGERCAAVAHWISARVFLIFFVHVLALAGMQRFLATLPGLPASVSVLLSALGTALLCLLAAFVLRCIPRSAVLLG